MKSINKKAILLLVTLLTMLLCGCRAESGEHETIESLTQTEISESETIKAPAPSLQILYKADTESYTSFSETDYKDKLLWDLEYFQVKDVMIPVGDDSVPLEDALCNGQITFAEIHYLAQKDADDGICYETVESKRGLTRFSYDYISYKLIITNDIYETPDGKQHHIRNLIVTRTGCNPTTIYPELDQEDWGIEFEVAEVTPSGITLNYTQSGGQIIGQLITGNYDLSRTDIVEAVLPLDYTPPEPTKIEHNTSSSIALDFEQRFGVLESGEYLLYLYLHDDYDPEQVPPLIRNYHDMQCYAVEFSIP